MWISNQKNPIQYKVVMMHEDIQYPLHETDNHERISDILQDQQIMYIHHRMLKIMMKLVDFH